MRRRSANLLQVQVRFTKPPKLCGGEIMMKKVSKSTLAVELEQIPNVGKAVAGDLRSIFLKGTAYLLGNQCLEF
jgi:hypothetical protein